MEYHKLVERVQGLSDLELATLICLIAKQPCSIEVADDLVDDLAHELALVVSEVFGLTYAVLGDADLGSVEDFGEAILDDNTISDDDFLEKDHGPDGDSIYTDMGDPRDRTQGTRLPGNVDLDTRKVVNVVIAKNFNSAPDEIQIQAMELVRRRRIFSRTTIHAVPSEFMLISIVPTSMREKRYMKHLNDRIFISHYHDIDDRFPRLEEMEDLYATEDSGSASSARNGSSRRWRSVDDQRISQEMIQQLRTLGDRVTMSAEVRTYLQNIVVFLRLERGVAGGVTPFATVLLETLSKYLAPFHGQDYVTPSLVALAVRKIYPHRIRIAEPEKERSIQYGGGVDAVKEVMYGLTPESVIEAVLNSVECPL